ncbi:MAG: hypothetical protein LBQ61_04310 [Spirochaetales bacterium]|jgi:MFS family permease|nr:hypothetical protein [Spirochaetales bacterium]
MNPGNLPGVWSNPYLWVFFTGLCAGLSLGLLPFFYPRESPRRRLSPGGWIFFGIFLSLAIAALLGLFFSSRGGLFGSAPAGWPRFSGPAWFFLGGAALGAGFLVCRFPWQAGLPAALLSAGFLFLFFRSLSSWLPALPEQVFLEYSLLAEKTSPDSGAEEEAFLLFRYPRFFRGAGTFSGEVLISLSGLDELPGLEVLSLPPAVFFAPPVLYFRTPVLPECRGGGFFYEWLPRIFSRYRLQGELAGPRRLNTGETLRFRVSPGGLLEPEISE